MEVGVFKLKMPETGTIKYHGNLIQYHIFGNGPKVLLGFHGFGQSGPALAPLAKVLDQEYTLFSLDLFYHGKSYWENGHTTITKKYWKNLLKQFLQAHHIDRFDICGFSMGARFALASVEVFPDKIDVVYLLAPDGIKNSIWYRLATSPGFFQRYFKSMIIRPQRFFRLLNFTKHTRLLNKSVSKFAATQMSTIKKRRQVYYSWLVFRDLTFNLRLLAELINRHNIKVNIFLAENDKLVTRKGMDRLLKHLKKYNLHTLKSSHHKLIEHTANFLAFRRDGNEE